MIEKEFVYFANERIIAHFLFFRLKRRVRYVFSPPELSSPWSLVFTYSYKKNVSFIYEFAEYGEEQNLYWSSELQYIIAAAGSFFYCM